jgi:hypothetical protein
MKLITHYDPKPIPDRRFDWSCYDDNYDADWQGEETGWVSDSIVGYGPTEAAAIASYNEQLEDTRDGRA